MIQRKRIYAIVVAGFLALCIFMAGCTSDPVEPGTPTAAPTTTAPVEQFAFNETDDNRTVTVPAGSEIVISLDENPTTGYSWNVTSARGLQYVNDTFIPPETELVGAGGVHVWQYLAQEKGDAEFSAVYMRPWEETTEGATTFSVTFIIE